MSNDDYVSISITDVEAFDIIRSLNKQLTSHQEDILLIATGEVRRVKIESNEKETIKKKA